MRIAGFQPLSLIDYPGVVASIIFTQGCPFRCAYCHNPDLIPISTSPIRDDSSFRRPLSEQGVIDRLFQHRGMIEGVCVTGGEPTIHHDLPAFIKRLKDFGLLVKLDTNGVHPRMVEELIRERLVDFFAMDLKHTWDHYPNVIGVNQPHVIKQCQETFRLIQSSNIPHEFRTTVYPGFHAPEDLESIAGELHDGERYALQQIRYQKTLDPAIKRLPPLDLNAIAERIRTKHPKLRVEVRE